MSRYYEIIVFTAAVKEYADWILDKIDPNKLISHWLYRNNTTIQNGVYLKDLNKLGRELSKVIIIDNNPENFLLHPQNGIFIKSWYNDPNDKALRELSNLLEQLALSGEKDLRKGLRKIN